MNVTPEMIAPHGLLGTEAVQHGHDRGVREAPAQRFGSRLEAVRLGRDDAEIERRERVRVGRCAHPGVPFAASADTETVAFEGGSVRGTAGQDRDVRDRREMTREEASDRSGSDDAHTLHSLPHSLPSENLIKYRDRPGSRQWERAGLSRRRSP
jgi:hypothetical protein